MKIFDTPYKRKSAIITTILMLFVVFLIFVFGLKYKDPPDEYGVEVNFGYTDAGKGDNTTSTEQVKTEPNQEQQQEQEQQEEEVVEQPTETPNEPPVEEEVVTQDTEDAPTVNNTPKTNTEPVTETTETTTPPKPKPKPKPKPDKSTTDALSSVLNGSSNNGSSNAGDGDSNQNGNQGDINGNPYANSYYGGGSGNGSGYGLNGRTKKSNKKFPQDCNEEGKVVVKIIVDRTGKVVSTQVAQSDDPCLNAAAKKTAKSYRFNADSKAPTRQTGFVVVNFSLGE